MFKTSRTIVIEGNFGSTLYKSEVISYSTIAQDACTMHCKPILHKNRNEKYNCLLGMLIFPSILGVFWYFILLQKWIQSERVVDPADSSAHVSNKEEAQSIPPTTIIANGSGVDMVAGTDGLSFKEMNATADENMESETRIQLEDGAIVMSNEII